MYEVVCGHGNSFHTANIWSLIVLGMRLWLLSRYSSLHGSRVVSQLPGVWRSKYSRVRVDQYTYNYGGLYHSPHVFFHLPTYVNSEAVFFLCRYDNKCDVWSIGCILWDMANSAEKFVNVRYRLTHHAQTTALT